MMNTPVAWWVAASLHLACPITAWLARPPPPQLPWRDFERVVDGIAGGNVVIATGVELNTLYGWCGCEWRRCGSWSLFVLAPLLVLGIMADLTSVHLD